MDSKIFLINPSNVTSGFAMITPRWLPVMAGATPPEFVKNLVLIDEAIEKCDYSLIQDQDLVGISIHTLNAKRGYEKIKQIKSLSSAKVVVGGVHATIFPDEVLEHADSIVTGDGDLIWKQVVTDFYSGALKQRYDGGKISGDYFTKARWDLIKHQRYIWASINTTKGCPEKCSFCSVWVTDGRDMRIKTTDDIIEEIKELYALGFRAILLADDNFYALGEKNQKAFEEVMSQRYDLMEKMSYLPEDVMFFTQTTIRTADDKKFLEAMKKARIVGALIGVEAVDKAGLASVKKDFNKTGQALTDSIVSMQENNVYVLGSFIVGLETDTKETYIKMLEAAKNSNMAFAQFVSYTPFPGTVDYFEMLKDKRKIKLHIPKYWLIDRKIRKDEYKIYTHPNMTHGEIEESLKFLWRGYYSSGEIIKRIKFMRGIKNLRSALAYFTVSKIFYKIYYQYGISADSAKTIEANWMVKFLGTICLKLFKKAPAPA